MKKLACENNPWMNCYTVKISFSQKNATKAISTQKCGFTALFTMERDTHQYPGDVIVQCLCQYDVANQPPNRMAELFFQLTDFVRFL